MLVGKAKYYIPDDMVKEIRKEAVEGFVEYVFRDTDTIVFEKHGLKFDIEQYLASQEKE